MGVTAKSLGSAVWEGEGAKPEGGEGTTILTYTLLLLHRASGSLMGRM